MNTEDLERLGQAGRMVESSGTRRVHYLAYGSNLHPLRIALRVRSARLLGTARLEGYRLAFRKRGRDRSAKCDLAFTADPADIAYGAVYGLSPRELTLLDRFEDLGAGYSRQQLQLTVNDQMLDAVLYLANASHVVEGLEPYDWYKGFVLAGAREHRFPGDYLSRIEAVSGRWDPDKARRNEMHALLRRLEARHGGRQ